MRRSRRSGAHGRRVRGDHLQHRHDPARDGPREMRDRWLRALRQAMRAVALVEERLGADPTAEASATSA
jgi:truncated hemoglobin YjbI